MRIKALWKPTIYIVNITSLVGMRINAKPNAIAVSGLKKRNYKGNEQPHH